METKEEKLDREFDELNEGLTAMQIIEWFEKEHSEPEIPYSERHQPGSLAWDMWEQWQRELVLYADGWKDALRAIEWRVQLENDINDIHYILTWFEDGQETILWWRQQNAIEGVESLRDSEGIWGVLWCEMLPVDVSEEDWDYREPN